MSWKPEVDVPGEGWMRNALTFATYDEAYDNARDAYVRWPVTTAYRAIEVDEPVNYKWVSDQEVGFKLMPIINGGRDG